MADRPYLNTRRRMMLTRRWLMLPPAAGVVSFLATWLIFYLQHKLDPLAPWTKQQGHSRVWWAACCGAVAFVCPALAWLVEFQFGRRN